MEEIRRQTIKGKYLSIDEKGFIDCTLIDCILEYSGGPVSFHRTRFQRCRYVFVGRAKRTVHSFKALDSCRTTQRSGASSQTTFTDRRWAPWSRSPCLPVGLWNSESRQIRPRLPL
jgi:hypothetical protein